MNDETAAIADFLHTNRKPLASYIRQKLLAAGASEYVSGLGKDGIENLECEAAGVLLDLACALFRRLHPEHALLPEEILSQFPDHLRESVRPPRSDAYYNVLSELEKYKRP